MSQAITSADRLFLRLRDAIVQGDVPNGIKLSETELAEQHQVSRAVVREAIGRLVSCRLVERKANVGARVVALSAKGLFELYAIRESLEGMAARLAAVNLTDDEIHSLKSLLANHYDEVKGGVSYYQEPGDLDFHYRIILGSKNQQLVDLLQEGIYHLVRMYRVQLGMAGPRVTRAYAEHQHILHAIEHRDQELTEILMRRHIQYSRDQIANYLLEQS